MRSPLWFSSIPASVRVISLATGIRWIGWGFAEPLLGVFLFSLLGSYTQASLVDAVGGLVFFLTLPIAGLLADRIPLKTFLLIGLVFFFLDGLWIAAALTGAVLFALLANVFDGIAVASDVVGRSTYIRHSVPVARVGSVMGFQDTIINLGWVVGAILNVFAVHYLSLPWIFFMVLPTNLIALFLFAWYLPSRAAPPVQDSTAVSFKNYWALWRDVFRWRNGLHTLALLLFLCYALYSIGSFIIPIHAYEEGASLSFVILLKIALAAPVLFSAFFGRAADRLTKRAIPGALILAGGLVLLFGVAHDYTFHLAINFFLGSVLVLLSLMVERMVTERVEVTHYGRVSAVFEGLKNAAGYVGAITLGVVMDRLGGSVLFGSLSAFLVLIALFLLYSYRVRYSPRQKKY